MKLHAPWRLVKTSILLIFVWGSLSSCGGASFFADVGVWLTGNQQHETDQLTSLYLNSTNNTVASECMNTSVVPVSAAEGTNETSSMEESSSEEEEEKRSRASQKLQFLDRIALISASLLRKEVHIESKDDMERPDDITPQSDLNRPGRHVHIVTTAALPWFTGTAVNPLLRAAHLHRKLQSINENNEQQYVCLVLPWLELAEDQEELYGRVFQSPEQQEAYVRSWLENDAQMPDVADAERGLEILWYPARYHTGLRSIFAMGDIMQLMDPNKMDVCILEEPEHCNWFRAPGDGWTQRFHFVVGIVHTNYKEYASSHYSGLWTAPALAMISSAMVRAYCHKVIKLSDALQTYAPEKESTSNVHGVRAPFIKEGQRRALATRNESYSEQHSQGRQVYFIGKLLWAKGLDLMLDLEDYYKQCTGKYFEIDIYGNGPDQKDIMRAFHGRRKSKKGILETTLSLEGGTSESPKEPRTYDASSSLEALQFKALQHLTKLKESFDSYELPRSFAELRRQPIPASFPGRIDHAKLTEQYKVFVNPSVSEVLCTTTAEALAMGKFAIIPYHPSNTFFLQFPNCLAYRSKFEFVANLRWALTHDPEPLTDEHLQQFTWEAATDRLIKASAITWREAWERERLGRTKLDERIAWFHNEIGKGTTGDMLRKFFGAGPVSHQVKYQLSMSRGMLEESEDEDEDDGLSKKFRSSSFAEAIRATVRDLSSFIQ